MPLDPWQERIVRGALALDRTGNDFASSEVGIVIPRQNGKSVIAEIVCLHAIFVRRVKVVYTAHLMATSRRLRERIQALIEANPDLQREVKQIRTANEEQSITLKSGARMDFVARTASAARGWSDYDVLVFDEAFALDPGHVGALMPIMFARSAWQIWYLSMAGMVNSTALRQVRQRGINGDDGLAYFEWSVDEHAYRTNPEAVATDPRYHAQANPALGIRIKPATIVRAQRTMDPVEFAREVLCVWDSEYGEPLIHADQVKRLVDDNSRIVSDVVFAFDVHTGLTSGAIGVAGFRSDGIAHVEITGRETIDHRPGVGWMVNRIVELDEMWHPVAWVMDGSGPARALLTELQARGIEPQLLLGKDLAQASMAFLKAANAPRADQLRILPQQDLFDAITLAKKRDVVDDWVFSRKGSGSDISCLMVAAMALHGLAVHGVSLYDVLESVR